MTPPYLSDNDVTPNLIGGVGRDTSQRIEAAVEKAAERITGKHEPIKSWWQKHAATVVVGACVAVASSVSTKACGSCSVGTFEPPYLSKAEAAKIVTDNKTEHDAIRKEIADNITKLNAALSSVPAAVVTAINEANDKKRGGKR